MMYFDRKYFCKKVLQNVQLKLNGLSLQVVKNQIMPAVNVHAVRQMWIQMMI